MRIPRIFHPEKLSVDKSFDLSTAASHHLTKVLRLGEAHPLILFDGDGYDYHAIVTRLGKTVRVNVNQAMEKNTESPVNIHLGQVISKGDKMEYTVQKAVELGVNAITPLFSERCDIRLNSERQAKKQRQWQLIIENACQQCGRSVVPVCHMPMQLNQWIETNNYQLKLMLEPTGSIKLSALPKNNIQSVSLLIGSEGGFSTAETTLANAHGFTAINLGKRILRTETAGVTMLAILQAQYGDLA